MAKKYIDAELLRKEIERRFWDYGTPLHDEEVTKKVDEILDILDTLSEQEQEQPVKNPCSFYSEGYGCEISPMKNCIGCEHNRWGWGTKVAKKQPASEELEKDEVNLEKEIYECAKSDLCPDDCTFYDFWRIARHFAEWGAEHLKR